MFGNTYTDSEGYLRYKSDRHLVHREVAHKEIYVPNKRDYNLPFSSYTVHHKNEHKKDNRKSNLEILTDSEHRSIHRSRNNRRKAGKTLVKILKKYW